MYAQKFLVHFIQQITVYNGSSLLGQTVVVHADVDVDVVIAVAEVVFAVCNEDM